MIPFTIKKNVKPTTWSYLIPLFIISPWLSSANDGFSFSITVH